MDNVVQDELPKPVQEKEPIPNAKVALILGVLSIAFCWWYGIPGLIMGIIALVLSNAAKKMYLFSPEVYSDASFKKVSLARVCAIAGIVLNGIFFLLLIIRIILGTFFGSFISYK